MARLLTFTFFIIIFFKRCFKPAFFNSPIIIACSFPWFMPSDINIFAISTKTLTKKHFLPL